ncbi:SusC/RagA family TonB-linked outer membrane protein [Mucilaginibacter daejeonensis]|uniref:SusC/RagA family TonB-linked outer membrane protein n=1 Tax=Mucilaginibacter daejeonensis TaxID=398049 RepID=UPI001D17B21B|nr:SusC/RagA family TonB-linked outer membrane protein [Mucilaginibacter daejeonensis]UEG52851.1 SusC/RagA family TonB-linked outer membrane protein [Mucilaginibacter daejeonensis]
MKKILLFLSLCFLTVTVFAQSRVITGTVVSSDKNEPLVGVTIQVKGSNTATQTDVNGKFSIKVTNAQNVVLTVKYVGFNYQEHTLRVGEQNLDVKMTASAATALQEVIFTGYGGTQNKITATGAVSAVDLKKVEDVPALNASALLRGTAPGISVSGGTQRPGQSATITIRNPTAFAKDGGQGTNPLFVIDDVIRSQSDFDLLDPVLIESINILKDAEAAIYGVSGANGVILVRTKRGRQGAPRVSFSSSLGISNATMLPKFMNSTQLATFNNDYNQSRAAQATAITGLGASNSYIADPSFVPNYYNADGFLVRPGNTVTNGVVFGTGTSTTDATRNTAWYTPDELAYYANNSTNWLKEAFQNAQVWREAVSISGGTDKVTYFVGADYVNQNSNFKGINSNKYGIRANVEIKPAKGLTTSVSLSTDVGYSKSYWYKLNSTTESLDNDVATLQNVQPWQQYFINGMPVILGASTTGGIDNINYFQIRDSNNFTSSKNYVTNILGKINYEIPGVKGLTATATFNKNINNTLGKQFGTGFAYARYSGTGTNFHIPGGTLLSVTNILNGDRVRLNPVFADSYQLDAGLNYSRSFGKHTISAIALWEQREANSEGVAGQADNVVPGALPYQTFTTGVTSSTQTSQLSTTGFQSLITRLNYSYADRYLLQLIYRRDGSSRFAPGQNWGGFPAASVGWVLSQENFFKNKVNWVDLFKVRASVGIVGTDNTRPYQYQANYQALVGTNGGPVFNEGVRGVAIRPNLAIPNINVTWDKFTKLDYGLDMAFLRNRLSFSADYFYTYGYDMLTTLSSNVPATIGAAVPTENFGKVNTFGYELQLTWRDNVGKFSYSFSPFFAWNDNKYVKYDLASGLVGTVQDLTGRSGDPGVFGYKSLGIIRTQEEANAIIASRAAAAGGAANVKIFGERIMPGMINYEDLNGDGVISTDNSDQKYLTKKASNHNSLGLNFNVGYGPVSMNVIMGMSWGGWTNIDGRKPFNQSSSGASIYDNRPVYWADHWTPTNTNARFPAPGYLTNYDVTSDFWLVRATSFSVTNATLNFAVPNNWASKIGLASARFFVTSTNPVQFINPFPNGYRDLQTGLYSYPTLRTVSLGLNIGL